MQDVLGVGTGTEEERAQPRPPASEAWSVREGVRGYTSCGALQLGMEDRVGSLEVGKLAGIVVVDRDIFAVPVDTIHEASVIITMMGGEVTFDALDVVGSAQHLHELSLDLLSDGAFCQVH